MKIGLFIPCYIDQFYPQVGIAALNLLERLGVEVEYPQKQTCCGQPTFNAGFVKETKKAARRFFQLFKDYEYVVCPSGSCTSMVRGRYDDFFKESKDFAEFEKFKQRVFELCEFLHDVLELKTIEGAFPYRVGLHQSCHGLRELRLTTSSERMDADRYDKVAALLGQLKGIELQRLNRPDECCGFGGVFSVSEDAVSARMGLDRLADHERAGVEVIAAVDMSCLMHLEGLIRREGKSLKVRHVAQLLAGEGA
jgi:L-lactate dehydrogenase complex protein LldE